jgi:hypothetical protein
LRPACLRRHNEILCDKGLQRFSRGWLGRIEARKDFRGRGFRHRIRESLAVGK